MAKQDSILAIDIGGSGLKAALIDQRGKLIGERLRVPTPYPCPPQTMIGSLVALCMPLQGYKRIAIGFPGVVRDGRVLTAPHFVDGKDNEWTDFPLADSLSQALGGQPARLVNDAEMQGLAVIKGNGLELVLTLGTGAGTALFRNGELMPHLELAQHPIRGHKRYNDYVGDVVLKKIGQKRWNRHVRRTIDILSSLLHFDHLFIGGGNATKLDGDLPDNVTTVSNDAGLAGGAALWQQPERPTEVKRPTAKKSAAKKTTKTTAKAPAKKASAKKPSGTRAAKKA